MSISTPACAARMKSGLVESTFAYFIRNGADVMEYISAEDLSLKELRRRYRKWVKFAVVLDYTVGGVAAIRTLDLYWKEPTPANLKRYRVPDMRRRKVTKTASGELRGKHICLGIRVVKLKANRDGSFSIPKREVDAEAEAKEAKPDA